MREEPPAPGGAPLPGAPLRNPDDATLSQSLLDVAAGLDSLSLEVRLQEQRQKQQVLHPRGVDALKIDAQQGEIKVSDVRPAPAPAGASALLAASAVSPRLSAAAREPVRGQQRMRSVAVAPAGAPPANPVSALRLGAQATLRGAPAAPAASMRGAPASLAAGRGSSGGVPFAAGVRKPAVAMTVSTSAPAGGKK